MYIYIYQVSFYVYIYIYICIHMCAILSEGLRPLPPAPRLEDLMIGRLDDSMDG